MNWREESGMELSQVISNGFEHYFEEFRCKVHHLSERLTPQQFWARPHPYGNSFGNLVLHLTGNLNYYIGTQIEGTGYVRDRDREFEPISEGEKEPVLSDLDRAVRMVIDSLQAQREGDWGAGYHAQGVTDVHDRFGMFLRCCVHFHHHIGQMIYLVKAWEEQKSAKTSQTVE